MIDNLKFYLQNSLYVSLIWNVREFERLWFMPGHFWSTKITKIWTQILPAHVFKHDGEDLSFLTDFNIL